MEIIIFLKPIFDMLYSVKVLDYVMVLALLLCFPLALKKMGRYVLHVDICVMALIACASATFARTFSGLDVYMKIVTAYMMYFVGRGFAGSFQKCKKALVASQIFVLTVNFICLLLGGGFILWGNARTFRGLYYYKSDLAGAMIQALCAILFFDKNKKHKIAAVAVSGIMVVLSNSRASIIIYLVVLLIYYVFTREHRRRRKLRVDLKMILLGGILVLVALLVTVAIISLPVFKNMGFISFDIKNLFSTSNLQGRDNVWKGILADFTAADVLKQVFGIDFVSDVWRGYDSHNSYIKVLFSTGYVGLGVFALFLILYISRLNRVIDRELFYFNLSSLIVFLLQSISQASIAFTQMTWIWMFFAGVSVTQHVRWGRNRELYSMQ